MHSFTAKDKKQYLIKNSNNLITHYASDLNNALKKYSCVIYFIYNSKFKVVGKVNLNLDPIDPQIASINYSVIKDYQNKGLASYALKYVHKDLQDQTKLQTIIGHKIKKVKLIIDKKNKASLAVANKFYTKTASTKKLNTYSNEF